MRYYIDRSAPWLGYCLAVCECGWRQDATSTDAAVQRLAVHERNVHGTSINVRTALKQRHWRAKATRPEK